MSIRKDQEILSKMLSVAQQYTREGQYEKARRAMVCAAAKLLQIAEGATASAKPVIEKKAYTIVRESVHISDDAFDDLIDELEFSDLGSEFDEDEIATPRLDKRVTFDQVVGLDDVKDTINRQIIYPIRYKSIYNKYRKKSGGGILLYGLPGTGKTMIAKAMANEIHAKFIPIKCSDIMSKWFGESEQKINDLFNEAKSSKLSIIFFDEFEALATKRSNCQGAMAQLVPELLMQIQGFNELENVIVVCATNRPWDIDSAFMRPGRLTSRIYVPLPSEEARELMLRKRLETLPFDGEPDYNRLAKMTEGYSGADIEEVCEYAKNFAIDREIASGRESSLTMTDMMRALEKVHTSIRQEDVDDMELYEQGQGFKTKDRENNENEEKIA